MSVKHPACQYWFDEPQSVWRRIAKMNQGLETETPSMRACAVALFFLLAGCTINSIDTQPDYWRERIHVAGMACPDISGSFAESNALFLFDDIKGNVSFGLGGAPHYYPWQWRRCVDCTAAITWHGDRQRELAVDLLSPSAGKVDTFKLRRDKDEFDCRDGLLLVPFNNTEEIGIAGAITRGVHAYSLAEDGSLVRRQSLTQFWHSDFVVPGKTTAEHYARWPAVARKGVLEPGTPAGQLESAPPDRGLVQVYRRPKPAASTLLVDLDISRGASRSPAIALKSGEYISYSASPGNLTISSTTGAAPPVSVPVVAGEVSYVRATVHFFGGISLENVDAATARKQIIGCSLQSQGALPP